MIRSMPRRKDSARFSAFTARALGTSGLATFSEVHSYAFRVGILLQFTSMVCQGLTLRFPKLKLAFLEIGATWLPYYLDRLDEHWQKRGEYEIPLLKKGPAMLSGSQRCISASSPANRSLRPPLIMSRRTFPLRFGHSALG